MVEYVHQRVYKLVYKHLGHVDKHNYNLVNIKFVSIPVMFQLGVFISMFIHAERKGMSTNHSFIALISTRSPIRLMGLIDSSTRSPMFMKTATESHVNGQTSQSRST